MATVNIIDQTSATVTANTPGKTLDLTNWATLGRTGVPVVLWVYASAATSSDTGQVILYDSSSVAQVTVNINSGAGWYSATGTLPATLGKYDVHFGNATSTLTIKDFSLLPVIT